MTDDNTTVPANNNVPAVSASAADPFAAALKATGGGTSTAAATTDVKSVPTTTLVIVPTSVKSDIALLTTDKPEKPGAPYMRDQVKPEVRAKAQAIATSIKIDDGLQATQFAISSQQAITEFSRDRLGKVKVKDSGLGDLFEEFNAEVKGLDSKSLAKPSNGLKAWLGGIPYIGKRWKAFRRFVQAQQSLETKLVNMTQQFEAAKLAQTQTAADSEELAKLNDTLIADLQLAIAAGEYKEDELVAKFNELAQATTPGNISEKTKVQRFMNLVMRFKARVHNLRKSLIASETTAPMFVMVNSSALDQVSSVDDFMNLAISEFRKQVLIGLMLHDQARVNEMLASGRSAFDRAFAGNTALLGEVQDAVAENQRKGIGSTEVLTQAVTDLGVLLNKRVSNIRTTLATWEAERITLEQARTELADNLDKANKDLAQIKLHPNAPVTK